MGEKVTDGEGERDGDRDRGGGIKKKSRKWTEIFWPHDLHVRVVLSSEEVVAAVCPHHVFVHRELDFPPELAVLLRAHGQPEKIHKKHLEFEKVGHAKQD